MSSPSLIDDFCAKNLHNPPCRTCELHYFFTLCTLIRWAPHSICTHTVAYCAKLRRWPPQGFLFTISEHLFRVCLYDRAVRAKIWCEASQLQTMRKPFGRAWRKRERKRRRNHYFFIAIALWALMRSTLPPCVLAARPFQCSVWVYTLGVVWNASFCLDVRSKNSKFGEIYWFFRVFPTKIVLKILKIRERLAKLQ